MNDEHCIVWDADASVVPVTRMSVDAVVSKIQGVNHQLVGSNKV